MQNQAPLFVPTMNSNLMPAAAPVPVVYAQVPATASPLQQLAVQPASGGLATAGKYLALLLVAVLLYLIATNAAGATPAPIGSGVSDPPGSGDTGGGSHTTSPPPPGGQQPKTAVVRITRVGVTPQSPAVEWSIGEARVFVNGTMLQKSDFSSAAYGKVDRGYNSAFPAWNALDGDVDTFTHTDVSMELYLDLTLKVPAVVDKVDIIGRTNCCEDRLANASVQLLGVNGTVHAKFSLAKTRDWQSFPVIY